MNIKTATLGAVACFGLVGQALTSNAQSKQQHAPYYQDNVVHYTCYDQLQFDCDLMYRRVRPDVPILRIYRMENTGEYKIANVVSKTEDKIMRYAGESHYLVGRKVQVNEGRGYFYTDLNSDDIKRDKLDKRRRMRKYLKALQRREQETICNPDPVATLKPAHTFIAVP